MSFALFNPCSPCCRLGCPDCTASEQLCAHISTYAGAFASPATDCIVVWYGQLQRDPADGRWKASPTYLTADSDNAQHHLPGALGRYTFHLELWKESSSPCLWKLLAWKEGSSKPADNTAVVLVTPELDPSHNINLHEILPSLTFTPCGSSGGKLLGVGPYFTDENSRRHVLGVYHNQEGCQSELPRLGHLDPQAECLGNVGAYPRFRVGPVLYLDESLNPISNYGNPGTIGTYWAKTSAYVALPATNCTEFSSYFAPLLDTDVTELDRLLLSGPNFVTGLTGLGPHQTYLREGNCSYVYRNAMEFSLPTSTCFEPAGLLGEESFLEQDEDGWWLTQNIYHWYKRDVTWTSGIPTVTHRVIDWQARPTGWLRWHFSGDLTVGSSAYFRLHSSSFPYIYGPKTAILYRSGWFPSNPAETPNWDPQVTPYTSLYRQVWPVAFAGENAHTHELPPGWVDPWPDSLQVTLESTCPGLDGEVIPVWLSTKRDVYNRYRGRICLGNYDLSCVVDLRVRGTEARCFDRQPVLDAVVGVWISTVPWDYEQWQATYTSPESQIDMHPGVADCFLGGKLETASSTSSLSTSGTQSFTGVFAVSTSSGSFTYTPSFAVPPDYPLTGCSSFTLRAHVSP